MTEQYEQQFISPRNTTVKPEHVTLPKRTTIALCFSTESTGFGSLQYELFVAHKESFKNYFRILGTGVNKKNPLLTHMTWRCQYSYFTVNDKLRVLVQISRNNLQITLSEHVQPLYLEDSCNCKSMNHIREYASHQASMNCMNKTKNMCFFQDSHCPYGLITRLNY